MGLGKRREKPRLGRIASQLAGCPAEAQAHAQLSCALEKRTAGSSAFQAEYRQKRRALAFSTGQTIARQKLPLLLPGRLNARCCCFAVVSPPVAWKKNIENNKNFPEQQSSRALPNRNHYFCGPGNLSVIYRGKSKRASEAVERLHRVECQCFCVSV